MYCEETEEVINKLFIINNLNIQDLENFKRKHKLENITPSE